MPSGGGNKSNAAQIQVQQQAANEARQKEQARAQRLQTGQNYINALFDGGEIMGSRWTGGTPGFDTTTTPGAAPPNIYDMTSLGDAVRGANGVAPRGTTASTPGSEGTLENFGTGQFSGGIGEDFYNRFRQAQNDYYLPDVERQYGKAKDTLTFDLARAGTLNSSMAGDQLADLVYQNTNNVAGVRAKADSATADLRQRVAQEKQNAISQLYATEDPDMAANDALARVRTISDTTPELNPLGDLFKLAAIGGGGFATNAGSPYSRLTMPRVTDRGQTYV